MKLVYIVYSTFQSHLNYGLLPWGPSMAKKFKDPLTILQKKAIRHVCNETYNAHTEPHFNEIGILKLSDIIDLIDPQRFFRIKGDPQCFFRIKG